MPFTPYHFGPSGFVGLLFRRWIDPVLFVAANVLVDFEVLFYSGRYAHRVWHFHSFLGGAIVGALFGAVIYFIKPLRLLIAAFMDAIPVRYKPSLVNMILGGSLGACFHVFVDSFYHWDVQPFYPRSKNDFWYMVNKQGASTELVTKHNVEIFCILSLVGVIILMAIAILQYNKGKPREDLKNEL